MIAEFMAAMAALGLDAPELVPVDYSQAPAAMGRGEVDMVCDFVDLLPRVRRQSGIDVRAVPLGLDVYSSGLVAADRLPDDLVVRMRAAVAAALERQREDPEGGLDQLALRYPDADPLEALEGWSLVEPNIFTGAVPGQSDRDTWARTIEFVAGAHGLPAPPPETVYRPELIDVPAVL
jgi:ABC-type nitrate/sulfonate/bicarbonate transport system substrate-binding protein